jgi:hypothetical protein
MNIDLPPRRVLNVGGNRKTIALPPYFEGFTHHLLDIDPSGAPDVVADARELAAVVPAHSYDAIYCSHNLEHYFRHDAVKVLHGFAHVLAPHGFVEIRVPDMDAVMRQTVERGLDIDDVLYESPVGPITVRDVVYGHAGEVERSGRDWYAHKTGFTRRSLSRMLNACGFPYVFCGVGNLEVLAYAFPDLPSDWARDLLRIPDAAIEAARKQMAGAA